MSQGWSFDDEESACKTKSVKPKKKEEKKEEEKDWYWDWEEVCVEFDSTEFDNAGHAIKLKLENVDSESSDGLDEFGSDSDDASTTNAPRLDKTSPVLAAKKQSKVVSPDQME